MRKKQYRQVIYNGIFNELVVTWFGGDMEEIMSSSALPQPYVYTWSNKDW